MALKVLRLYLIIFLTSFYHSQEVISDEAKVPAFAFSLLNDNGTFMAGDTATIKVKVLGNYDRGKYKFSFNPNITINDKMGNSSFISGVFSYFDGDTENWRICFTPIMVGSFNVLITDENFSVLDSSLSFEVNTGRIYPEAAVVSWMGGVNEFIAGTKADVLVIPKDPFGNNVSIGNEGLNVFNFSLFASTLDGFPATVINVTINGWGKEGYVNIEFVASTAGNLLFHVEIGNQTLQGSPLPFKVNPGNLEVPSCITEWKVETRHFQLFSMMEASIHQYDGFGNLVSGVYEFDIEVLEKGNDLPIPISDLSSKETSPGIQSFSFSLQEAGSFMLVIADKEHNTLISNMPYDFTVYIGYCDGMNSIVNGSGLNNSVAGDIVKFSVFLTDTYLYPSPVELESLHVQILHESDMDILRPNIQARELGNGSLSSGRLNHEGIHFMQIASAPVVGPENGFAGNSNKSSVFDIIYRPVKSGMYEIRVFCGNIPLNAGNPFRKEVSPGLANLSLSGIVDFAPKVPKLAKNEVVVRLMDSYYNPIPSQGSRLKLEIASVNKSACSTSTFSDYNNGSYMATYEAKSVGTYEICASYDGEHFTPCPVGVNVYSSEYFPKANNDTVSVWEDESISFNVLENDYFAGGNTSIASHSRPGHGSLLQNGNLFRYTPYKGYYGNDSFAYTFSDINGNIASGSVDLLVLCVPPQLVSVPTNLQATEDLINPMFGGFSGFEIIYSDAAENITVTLSSQSGSVLLSPTPMQFWQQSWTGLSVHKELEGSSELTLIGCLDIVNFALQTIQFSGNENFYGDTSIRVSTINKNGRNDIDLPIYVQPINDPPIISVPSFMILEEKSEGMLIFTTQRNNINFIEDPDLQNFPGNKSHFLVMFSLEVSSGFLSTTLPAELIDLTEVKLKTSYQWQPLLTFVTISNHFLVKAKGIRFRGTIDDCNSIMGQLQYHEGKHGAVLTVTVNDLGNHGCYPNCNEMMSMSLLSESTVNLITRSPMSSMEAHSLGSAIITVSILVFLLAVLLLFYICKCARVLVREKKRRNSDIELSQVGGSGSSRHTLSSPLKVPETEEMGHFIQNSTKLSSDDQNQQASQPLDDIGPSVYHMG